MINYVYHLFPVYLKEPLKEDVECDPWTVHAKHKYNVEQEMKNIPDLNWIIVRPALVYGPGDKSGIGMFFV